MQEANNDLEALFNAVEKRWQVLRAASLVDLSSKKDFKRFIRARNDFHGALSELNETLYASKDALILPELIDLDDWGDEEPPA